MRITKEQEAFLDTLVCQRLTDDENNKQLIRSFECARNRKLSGYLKYYGWEEDTEGKLTFYVIKNKEDQVLLYFSLKCGELFDPMDEKALWANIQRYRDILEDIHSADAGSASEEKLAQLAQLQVEFGMTLYHLEHHLEGEIRNKTRKLREINEDRRTEANPGIARVGRTYPAVELVHFCANDDARLFWFKAKRQYRFLRSMGEVLFWRFVAPLVGDIHKILGCQYIYLFAADLSHDGSLVNYYRVSLNFDQPQTIGANKPRYDFTSDFMCQEIAALRDYRQFYFDHFNLAPGEDPV